MMLPNRCPACDQHGLTSTLDWYGRVHYPPDVVPYRLCTLHDTLVYTLGVTWCSNNHVYRTILHPPCVQCGKAEEITLDGRLCIGDATLPVETRFIDVCVRGVWKQVDLLHEDLSEPGKEHFYKLHVQQQAMVRDRIKSERITWLLCARKLGLYKDVARLVASHIGSGPPAPVMKLRDEVWHYSFVGIVVLFIGMTILSLVLLIKNAP